MWQNGLALILCAVALAAAWRCMCRAGKGWKRFEMYNRGPAITLGLHTVTKVNIADFGSGQLSGDFVLKQIVVNPVAGDIIVPGDFYDQFALDLPLRHTHWEIEATFVAVEDGGAQYFVW